MKILITGGSGFLGKHLVPIAAGTHEVCYTFFRNDPLNAPLGRQLDIRDDEAVTRLATTLGPQVVIHTAGSEQSGEEVIRLGTANIVRAAAAIRARLIHLSTDVLFNGRRAPYDEDAQPEPLHAYGHAKAAAESIVQQYDHHVIIRTSLIFSLDEMDRATARLVDALKSGQPYMLFTDQRRNPVWVETLSRACVELAEMDYGGILNVAGRQVLTRAELGLRLLDWWEVDERETLSLGASDGDQWPRDCELDLRRATKVLSTPLLGVDEVLQRARDK